MLCPAFERIGQGLSQAEQSTATICIFPQAANQRMKFCTYCTITAACAVLAVPWDARTGATSNYAVSSCDVGSVGTNKESFLNSQQQLGDIRAVRAVAYVANVLIGS